MLDFAVPARESHSGFMFDFDENGSEAGTRKVWPLDRRDALVAPAIKVHVGHRVAVKPGIIVRQS
jgi:hypothetical protein